MKSSKIRTILIVLFVFLMVGMTGVLCGCSTFGGNDKKTPEKLIQDAYGNEQYKISFSSTTLQDPISPIYYTAINIPCIIDFEKFFLIISNSSCNRLQ